MEAVAPCRAQSVVCIFERDKNSVSLEQGILVMSERQEEEQMHEIKSGSRQSSQKRSQSKQNMPKVQMLENILTFLSGRDKPPWINISAVQGTGYTLQALSGL